MAPANPETPRRIVPAIRRVGAWSALGGALVVLVALAAQPAPITSTEDRVDGAIELYGKGDRPGARRVADELVRSIPAEPLGWLLVGMLDEDRQAIADAEHAYTVALGLLDRDDPRHVDVLVTLADLRRRKGDPQGALKAIDKVARERGESGRIRHARVLSLIDLRRFDDALSETRLIAEEKLGGGVAKKLEKQIRSLMNAKASRNG